jgi:hypothetical protein
MKVERHRQKIAKSRAMNENFLNEFVMNRGDPSDKLSSTPRSQKNKDEINSLYFDDASLLMPVTLKDKETNCLVLRELKQRYQLSSQKLTDELTNAAAYPR